jgi:LysM repeat protein
MLKYSRFCVLAILIASLWAVDAPSAQAQASGAGELIGAVNALRASNGLGPLQENASLMSSAQAQSNYQASINTVTHDGPGGSRPRDRAAAAGYGGGATIYISENIMGGPNLSAQSAVQTWTGDSPHWNTMMGNAYADIGAGVATSGDYVYYTIDVGYYAGIAKPTSNGTAQPTRANALTPLPTVVPILPLITSTQSADGSVIHVVQYGQTLITIAKAYGITVDQLKALNKLKTDSIFIGDKLTIHPAPTKAPTSAITPTPTLTLRPTSTRRPPTRTPTITPTPEPSPTPKPTSAITAALNRLDRRSVGMGIIVICAAGLLVVGLTSFKPKRPSD